MHNLYLLYMLKANLIFRKSYSICIYSYFLNAYINFMIKLINKVTKLKARVNNFTIIIFSSARTQALVAAISAPIELNATSRILVSQQYPNRTILAPINVLNVIVDISRADSRNSRILVGTVRVIVEKEMRTRENLENQ